ncbi:unnamed protein product, partial [Musa acuminata subsp. burmannicoides]
CLSQNASTLKISNRFRASATAVYEVELIDPEAKEHEFDAPDDTYIPDAAETAGLGHDLPVLLRWCPSHDGSFLDETQMAVSPIQDQTASSTLIKKMNYIDRASIDYCIDRISIVSLDTLEMDHS